MKSISLFVIQIVTAVANNMNCINTNNVFNPFYVSNKNVVKLSCLTIVEMKPTPLVHLIAIIIIIACQINKIIILNKIAVHNLI